MAARKLGDAWVTAGEAARILGLPLKVVRDLIRNGDLARVNPKGQAILARADVENLLRGPASGVTRSENSVASQC